jgi:hypothetical protein
MTSGRKPPRSLKFTHAIPNTSKRKYEGGNDATLISSRSAPAAGAAGAVVYVVSAFTAGSPLKPDASVSKVVAHLSDKRGALLAGVLLAVIGRGTALVVPGLSASPSWPNSREAGLRSRVSRWPHG